jgi:hypothetical protein
MPPLTDIILDSELTTTTADGVELVEEQKGTLRLFLLLRLISPRYRLR